MVVGANSVGANSGCCVTGGSAQKAVRSVTDPRMHPFVVRFDGSSYGHTSFLHRRFYYMFLLHVVADCDRSQFGRFDQDRGMLRQSEKKKVCASMKLLV